MAAIRNFHSIQHLRAVAALMVVAYHAHVQLQRIGYEGPWLAGLARGVDLFFVISGFIMVMATRDGVTPRLFLLRRFLRIAPLYYALTLLMLAIHAIEPRLLQSFVLDARHVLASFAFWPWPNLATGLMQPVLIPGWTLNYEMFFYALFALSMLAGRRSLAVLGVMFLGLVALGRLVDGGPTLAFFADPLILLFLAGVVLGRLYRQGWRIPVPVAAPLAVLALPLLATMPPLLGGAWDSLLPGLVATAVVAALVSLEAAGRLPEWRTLVALGDASYAIYLIHGTALAATGQAWRALGMPADPLLLTLACIGTGTAAGLVGYWALERPLGRWLKQLTATRAPAALPQPAGG
ncbi:acyltransferase [Roseococcus sp. SYP-B2431]|uniref:acyltransferase family protein n=1 Tax=Roseococcus sp. SYP-B2431 TaxID=2496640 RepID=UPI001038EACD|nr:acyltransferase [Roseococcus sp. SYP-B2431]